MAHRGVINQEDASEIGPTKFHPPYLSPSRGSGDGIKISNWNVPRQQPEAAKCPSLLTLCLRPQSLPVPGHALQEPQTLQKLKSPTIAVAAAEWSCHFAFGKHALQATSLDYNPHFRNARYRHLKKMGRPHSNHHNFGDGGDGLAHITQRISRNGSRSSSRSRRR